MLFCSTLDHFCDYLQLNCFGGKRLGFFFYSPKEKQFIINQGHLVYIYILISATETLS